MHIILYNSEARPRAYKAIIRASDGVCLYSLVSAYCEICEFERRAAWWASGNHCPYESAMKLKNSL